MQDEREVVDLESLWCYEFSHELSRPLVDLILHQHDSLPHDVIDSQFLIFKQLSQARHQGQVDATQSVLARSSSTLRQAIECCQDKGASSWLSALPRNSKGSPFTRMNLLMLFVCIMAGLLLIYLRTVFFSQSCI